MFFFLSLKLLCFDYFIVLLPGMVALENLLLESNDNEVNSEKFSLNTKMESNEFVVGTVPSNNSFYKLDSNK